MFFVISYDIVDDKRRMQMLKLLKGYGTHVQYSVFECDLTAPQFARLRHAMQQAIDPMVDSVRCYVLDATAVQQIQVLGIGRVSTDPLYYLIG
jgi:CRISPR-associated protein Cas2